jgi:hypothetical protein
MAVSRQRIWDNPSSCSEKELPRLPSQEELKCSCPGEWAKVFPAMEINKVITDVSSAQVRTVLSFFIKKDRNPPINGTKNSNKTIISIQNIFQGAKAHFINIIFSGRTAIQRTSAY